MKYAVLAALLLLVPVAYAQSSTADRIGTAIHPVYIMLAYTCVPALNEISSLCSSLGLSLCLTPLCPLSPLLLACSGCLKFLTMPVVYCVPLLYSFLGLMGGNPNFFIGGLGDLVGHFCVDMGSAVMSLSMLCLPCGVPFTACGDFITLFCNGLSVLVVGDIFTAVQQFVGAAILGVITILSFISVFCCLSIICTPLSFIFSFILSICTNVVGLATDMLGQGLTYCRPLLAKAL